MPTFTTIAWETLLEPSIRGSYKSDGLNSTQEIPKSPVVVVVDGDGNKEREEEVEKKKKAHAPNHVYISPALYVTPVPAPIPDSSTDPPSPSPYVVNHKRRGGEGFSRHVRGFDECPKVEPGDCENHSNSISNFDRDNVVEDVGVNDKFFGMDIGGEDRNGAPEAEDDGFFDPRCDSLSVASSTEIEGLGKQADCQSYASIQGEFFDADEDFSSDGSMSNSSSAYVLRIESELRASRLSLLEEIEKRKIAESATGQIYNQWQRLGNLLSEEGLTFPRPPNVSSMQLDIESLEQCCQELLVARFVAEAIGRGEARAEAEIAAEAIIASKDQEISRLRDRLQYYEAVNREMCQRNQEVMEVARRQRQRKRNQRRWLWGCIGLSVAIGTSVIAYSYLPQTSTHDVLPGSNDSPDASCINTTESA